MLLQAVGMKSIKLIIICVLLIAHSVQNAESENQSLEILKRLKNQLKGENEKVSLSCEVKNATSYLWYQKGQLLTQNDGHSLTIRGGNLTIEKFSDTLQGAYTCEGRDENGNSGKTSAWITFQHPCRRVREAETHCFNFNYERDCPKITSFAPKAENLRVEFQLDYEIPFPYPMYFGVTWDVPRQGRESIRGWQLRIFGVSRNVINYQRCYQFNTKRTRYEYHDSINTAIEVPKPASTYVVEVQGLPNLEKHNKTIVRMEKKVPGYCEMELSELKVCCESYVNASLGAGEHNRTTLFWTTNYPVNSNITIDAFIVKWISRPDDRCNAGVVRLSPTKSNYTLRDLKPECGNYTVELKVMFAKNKLKCDRSPPETMFYISPQVVTSTPATGEETWHSVATIGYTMAAIFAGFVIVAMIYLYRNRKSSCKGGKSHGPVCGEPPGNLTENVSVFILNPNHCELCTEVVHTLGSLLIETGQIRCEIDMFVPMKEKCRGLARWTEDMILKSDYVIIPWMCEITTPKQDNMPVTDMNTLLFLSSLDIIHGELVRNPQRKDKFIPVCLDHCSLEILPASQVLLQTYNIPSKVDDLVLELLGKTRRQPDTKWPILEFDDKLYTTAKRNLEQAVNKMKKNHHSGWQKSSDKFPSV